MSLLCRSLSERLAASQAPDRLLADELASHLESALSYVRMLARGIRPVEPKAEGLMDALQDLAAMTSRFSGVSCRVDIAAPVLLDDNAVASTLFRIAQEGVTNALRHAHPRSIVLSLTVNRECYELRVIDDGAGMPEDGRTDGMGMRIMQYRAALVGATINVAPTPGGGTTLSCLCSRARQTLLQPEEYKL
jgi:signal transduction histidine kinase